MHITLKEKQEAHGPRHAHLSEIVTADMHLLYNFFQIVIAINKKNPTIFSIKI